MRANCRNCKNFVPVYALTEKHYELIREWLLLHRHKRKIKIYGFCLQLNKPVTHLEGECRFYLPKHKEFGSRKITEF
ncbi:MAG: hypothetical protein ACXQTI_03640, partial [Candidatus Nezhaarchaeales archaeon]